MEHGDGKVAVVAEFVLEIGFQRILTRGGVGLQFASADRVNPGGAVEGAQFSPDEPPLTQQDPAGLISPVTTRLFEQSCAFLI